MMCACVVQCSAVQCSAVQCSAVQCSVVQCSAVQCSAVQCSAVWCVACGVWRVVWHGVAVWFYDIVWGCKSGME